MRFLLKFMLVSVLLLARGKLLLADNGLQGTVDPQSIAQSSASLRARIVQAISDAGGDADRQQLHLVLGFSTGHFARDPLCAEAARGIGRQLLRNLLIRNDRLSVYAWEMHTWDYPHEGDTTVTVSSDAPAVKERLPGLFPLTPQTGSQGGHDTEQALLEIANKVQGEHDAVVVLLTNNAASVAPPHGRVIGADNPAYRAMLADWRRLAQADQTGATVVLPYTVLLAGQRPRLHTLDAVMLLPRSFSGVAISPATRTLRLQDALRVIPPPTFPWGVVMTLLLALLAIAAVLAIVLPHLRGRGGQLLLIAGQRFDLASLSEGEEICHLAGVKYPSANERTVEIAGVEGLPPLRLARLLKSRGRVRVQGDFLKMHALDGAVISGACVLTPGERHRLTFRGECAPDPAMPPRQVRVEVDAEIIRAEGEKERKR